MTGDASERGDALTLLFDTAEIDWSAIDPAGLAAVSIPSLEERDAMLAASSSLAAGTPSGELPPDALAGETAGNCFLDVADDWGLDG